MIFLAVAAMADEACVGHFARLALARRALVPVETNGPPVWHVVVVALAFAFLVLVALAVALPWVPLYFAISQYDVRTCVEFRISWYKSVKVHS